MALSFFLLAPYVALDAALTVAEGRHAGSSSVRIALSLTSLITMPVLGRAKRRLGDSLGSYATAAEGTQNLLCGGPAGAVLLGLLANTLLGLWWIDPVIPFVIARRGRGPGRTAHLARRRTPR